MVTTPPRSISGEQIHSCGCKEPRPHSPPSPISPRTPGSPLHTGGRRRAITPRSPRRTPSAVGQRPPGSAPRLRLAGAWWAAPQRGRTRRAARPSLSSPGPGPAPHSHARRRKLQPAGRKLWPQPGPCLAPAPSHATKGCGVVEGPPRPRRGPQRPGRAEDPLPPAERSPVVAGSSLTRAMVAVAILRPSRPQRAPHAPAPSAVSRDVGACGGARRKTELSR